MITAFADGFTLIKYVNIILLLLLCPLIVHNRYVSIATEQPVGICDERTLHRMIKHVIHTDKSQSPEQPRDNRLSDNKRVGGL